MPELPEVETIRHQLSHFLPLKVKKMKTSKNFLSLLVTRDFSLKSPFEITKIERHGKFLKFILPTKKTIISHLGMTGGWIASKEPVKDKHNHIMWECESSQGPIYLNYVDYRRFGKMHWVKNENLPTVLKNIGVDISSKDFHFDYLKQVLKKYPNRQIKPFLLDQKFFAGSGNYIASEICARAGIRPTRRAGRITQAEMKLIIKATDQVLKGSLKTRGVTFQGGYRDVSGDRGDGVKNLVVFNQELCQLCHETPVIKTFLAQRGTYHCPKCQK